MLEVVCSVTVFFLAEHNGFNRYYASRQGVRLIGPIAFEQLVHRLINVNNRSKIILPIAPNFKVFRPTKTNLHEEL